MALTTTLFGPALDKTSSDVYRRRGYAATSISPATSDWNWWNFFEGGNMRISASGSASTNTSPSQDGGQCSFSAGDGSAAGSVSILAATINGVAARHVANAKTSVWYVAFRGKLTTVPGANAVFGVGFEGTGSFFLGVNAAASTSKFTMVSGATTITSSVSIDTAMHVFEMWNTGSTLYISVDSEAPVSGATTNLPNGVCELALHVATNSSEAAQTIVADYAGILTGAGT